MQRDRLSPATYGRTLALQMRAAEPEPRDRRHTALNVLVTLAALAAVALALTLAIHSIGERLL